MSALYLTAFLGRHEGGDIPGHLWTPDGGQPIRQIIEALRQESPWIAARLSGREIFTLDVPDNPEADHLAASREGSWKPDFTNLGTRGLVLLLLLRHLKATRVLVDARTGFATVSSQELPDGRLAVDGLELHLEPRGRDRFLLWFHPVRRVLDSRPNALSEQGHRASDVWFPIDGVSVASAHPKVAPGGHILQIGHRGRLVRDGDPAAVILSETPADLSAQSIVRAVRNWFPSGGMADQGLFLEPDPCPAEELGLAPTVLVDPDVVALDWEDREIPVSEVFRQALGGMTALRRPRLPAATFHISGIRDPRLAEQTALILNQRAAEWPGVALQFASEPVEGSTELRLDARAPVVLQPRSPRASGQAAGLFLECVRRAGGDPWRLDHPGAPWSLGVAQAFLYGKMHHLALALLDPMGRIAASLVVPFRFADLSEHSFGRSLASRLWSRAPDPLEIHVEESLELPAVFLESLAPHSNAWHLRRRSAGRAFSGTSYEWIQPGEGAVGPDRLLACVDSDRGPEHIVLDRLKGTGPIEAALQVVLALEHAWVPGRAERRRLPATLEWARGLLYQRDRFQAFAPGKLVEGVPTQMPERPTFPSP
ncbi:MAG TPA: hypothetical protein VN931_04590 [Fibrobacteria bacterium]|nr:hypothetical protein [Fibrobacteria bacterium]